VYGSVSMLIMSAPRQPRTKQGEGARTKVDDVEDLRGAVTRDAREELAVRTRGDADDGRHVRAVVLHELDARLLLLPQLQVPVDGRRDQEVRPAPPVSHAIARGGGGRCAPGHDAEVERVAVHERLVVPVRAREVVQVELFVREDCDASRRYAFPMRIERRAHAPLRFFFAPPAAPAGSGIGPMSSSLSSSAGAGGTVSTGASSPSRARLPSTGSSVSDMSLDLRRPLRSRRAAITCAVCPSRPSCC
jgi:hypothetical protein